MLEAVCDELRVLANGHHDVGFVHAVGNGEHNKTSMELPKNFVTYCGLCSQQHHVREGCFVNQFWNVQIEDTIQKSFRMRRWICRNCTNDNKSLQTLAPLTYQVTI